MVPSIATYDIHKKLSLSAGSGTGHAAVVQPSMEQEVARWLFSQLGYNASADATLSSNCRGNLKGLWEFVITNYKTVDSKRHIQHVLAKHRREQEAARRAPGQQKEADARRQRLYQLRKKVAELEQTQSALQARTVSRVQEATEQSCEQSLMQHVLHETQAQTLLLQACVHRGQQLLSELQARLSQLQYTRDTVKARCRHTGGTKLQQSVQQQLATLSSSIKEGLHQAMWDVVEQQGIPIAGADLQRQVDQHTNHSANQQLQLTAAGPVSSSGTAQQEQHQNVAGGTAEALQQLLRVCKLVHDFKLPPDVLASALQLLQHPPSMLWDTCAQLAHQNLLELTARLDEAEREMLAPLHWPGSGVSCSMQLALLQHKPDQEQQLGVYGDCASNDSKYKLPWASGLSLPTAAAMQELGISPPPEIRIKLRLKDHIQLHINTQQTLQRVQAAQGELDGLLGSTPLLQAALAGIGGGQGVSWEAELAQVYINVVRARAQVQLLQSYEQRFEHELLQLKEIKAITEDKRQDVQQQMSQDHELNMLLHLAAADTMELEASLRAHQQHVAQLLSLRLLPCGTAAAEASQNAMGQQQREVAAVLKLPVLDLAPPVRILAPQEAAGGCHGSSESNPVLRKTTLTRLQSAGQQLLLAGRATTGAKPFRAAAGTSPGVGLSGVFAGQDALAAAGSGDSTRRFGDSAAVAALKGASLLDPAAPLRCPAALLLDVAGECQEARQLQQQVGTLQATSMQLAATINDAVHQEEQLQEKVDLMHLHERQDILPQLQALLEEGQAARAFIRDQVLVDYKHSWEMPAMHLVPHHTYQGKDCSAWLQQVQQLHAQKKELTSGTGHAHMA